jgi:hypothetical protein
MSTDASHAAAVVSLRPVEQSPLSPMPRLILSMTAGIAGGVLACAAIILLEVFEIGALQPGDLPRVDDPRNMTAEQIVEFQAVVRTNEYLRTSLFVAAFGAAVGGVLGFVAGVARKSLRASSAGLLGGIVVGAMAGALGGMADLFALERLWPMEFDHTYKAMVGHTTAFLIAGVGIGGAAGLVARQLPQTLGVVLAAALIAGLVYPGIAAYFFPVLNTDAAVPDGFWSLLLWTILPALLMGIGIGRTHAPLR